MIMKLLLILCSILGIIVLLGFVNALIYTFDSNFYTLAFGLPKQFDYLYTLLYVFVAVVCCSIVYFMFSIRKVPSIGVVVTILFSNSLIIFYFLYWEILTF